MPTKQHLEKMQLARVEALKEQSPRERGNAKILEALRWIYRWGWSSASLVELVAHDNRNGLTGRLVKQGLVTKTLIAAGGLRNIPAHILVLTDAGIAFVEKHIEDESELLPYKTNPLHVSVATLRHDMLAQSITAKAYLSGTINSFQTPCELLKTAPPQLGIKQPDAVWKNDKVKIALEVELTAKWARALDQFVGAYIAALTPAAPEPAKYDVVFLYSDSAAILSRYHRAFSPGTTVGVWAKNDSRHWVQVNTYKVPSSMGGKLQCKQIGSN
jgi:hypothetical protein